LKNFAVKSQLAGKSEKRILLSGLRYPVFSPRAENKCRLGVGILCNKKFPLRGANFHCLIYRCFYLKGEILKYHGKDNLRKKYTFDNDYTFNWQDMVIPQKIESFKLLVVEVNL
jgi:hypothetical protein